MTINEMAKRYCKGSSFTDSCIERPAYIAGANAVLEQIGESIDTKDSAVVTLRKIVEKVKELRGL